MSWWRRGRWGPVKADRRTLIGDGLGQVASEVKGPELLDGLIWLVLTDKACTEGKATFDEAVVAAFFMRAGILWP